MNTQIRMLAMSAFIAMSGGMVPDATATITEVSFLSVTEPLDVGGTVIQPGEYVIRVLQMNASRNVLQVTSVDESKVYATVLSIPHANPTTKDLEQTEYVFYPGTADSMQALRTWFAPGSTSHAGHDIVYPQARARELAALATTPVTAYRDEVKPEEFERVELEVVTPEQEVVAYVEPKPVVKPVQVAEKPVVVEKPVAVAAARQLPQTASQSPLFALLGLLMIGAAAGIRSIRVA